MSKRATHTALLQRLEDTLLRGPGEASSALRTAAAQGQGEGPLAELARQVQTAAYQVTAEQLAELQRSHSDDVLFETIVCAAFGAARARHEAGLAALDAAWEASS